MTGKTFHQPHCPRQNRYAWYSCARSSKISPVGSCQTRSVRRRRTAAFVNALPLRSPRRRGGTQDSLSSIPPVHKPVPYTVADAFAHRRLPSRFRDTFTTTYARHSGWLAVAVRGHGCAQFQMGQNRRVRWAGLVHQRFSKGCIQQPEGPRIRHRRFAVPLAPNNGISSRRRMALIPRRASSRNQVPMRAYNTRGIASGFAAGYAGACFGIVQQQCADSAVPGALTPFWLSRATTAAVLPQPCLRMK